MIDRRVLFVCPTCSPIGGLQTWLDKVCAGLIERGWDPIVALVHGPTTNDSASYRAAHPDLNTVVIDGTAMTMGARVREVISTIRRINPSFYVPLTVIDAHDAVCQLKSMHRRCPTYVLTVHGNLPQQIADARLYQPFADVSINPGALTCRLLEWAGMPKDRVFHAPNGIDQRPWQRPETSSPDAVAHFRFVQGISTDSLAPTEPLLRLAYVGRLTHEDKRVMDLVGLVKALEAAKVHYHLDVVGSGPCEKPLREALTLSTVTFHGFIESERLHRDFYPQWDVLLMFSQSEAFGLSLVEAMVHGVVPVSSRFVGSGAEGFLIEGRTARLFAIGDAVACAQVIKELSHDRGHLLSLARNGHQLVTERYSWDRCVNEWEATLLRCREFVPRAVPAVLPRPLDEGNSIASRFPWLSPRLSDTFYKVKRGTFGVPEAMKRGEEWPLHTGRFTKNELMEIEALTAEMDQQCVG
jgi:glycosyltransferase involved in cell wall biosynthesis